MVNCRAFISIAYVLASHCLVNIAVADHASIGVNFYHDTKVAPAEHPGIVNGASWNNVSAVTGTTQNLRDNSGAATTADITVDSGAGYGAFGNGGTGFAGFDKMVDDGVHGTGQGGKNNEARISVVQIPYPRYDVYVFAQSRTINGTELSITIGDRTYYYATDGDAAADEIKQITSTTPGEPTHGGSYIRLRNLSGASLVISTGGSKTNVISNQVFGVHIVDATTDASVPAVSNSATSVTSHSKGLFFKQYCVQCHNAEDSSGSVRLDQLDINVTDANYKLWQKIVYNIQRGDMPPEDQTRPSNEERQAFLEHVQTKLQRYEADNQIAGDPLLRLTNQQIAHSLQDLLDTPTHIADRMIGDPIHKHGFSVQSELDFSGSHMLLYADLLDEVLLEVFPDQLNPPDDAFRVVGNDWEKCHWGGDNFLYQGFRRLYEGPDWLGEKFRIPIPPKHEFRMFLRDNRSSGRFRISLTVRNEPPADGGPRVPQELGIYLCQGGDLPYKLVRAIQVPAKKGSQEFEMFGSLADHLGISTKPIIKDDRSPGYWLSFRTLTITNHNELKGFKLPARFLSTEPVFLVRSDDQWIKEFGNKPGLRPSTHGNNGRHGNEGGGPAVYADAMKSHGHAIIERVEFEVPYHVSWPPPAAMPFVSERRISHESLHVGLKQFAARAWRRTLDAEETAYIKLLCEREKAAGRSGAAALRNVLKTILLDGRFLYLNNSDRRGFASRLSYFLWNGPPDAKLMATVGGKTPITDDAVKLEVDRLLADKRSERFVTDFVGKWIDFTAFDAVAIDPNFYPRFKNTRLGVRTKEHMKLESTAFFSEILHQNLSCMNFLESDFVMLNHVMAEHYAATPVHSARFVRRPVTPSRGGGLLAQGSFLLGHSNGQDAHAVKRGVWLRGRLLGDPPSDPPPEVPGLDEQSSADRKHDRALSIKEKFDLHLATGTTCSDCHKDIDPWGIAMEGFNAVGLPRTHVLKAGPVSKTVQIDGRKIGGLASLKQYLMEERRNEFARGLTQHMLSYAIGRPLTYRDEKLIVEIEDKFKTGDYQLRALLCAIATSPVFKEGPSQDPNHDNTK